MKNVLMVGPFLSQSGYGEQARFAYRSFKENSQYNIYIKNLNWGRTGRLSLNNPEITEIEQLIKDTAIYEREPGQNKYDISIQITIPNEWEGLAPINIGYTAGVECDRISADWIKASNNMDRIIVPSTFSKDVFTKTEYLGKDSNTGKEVKLSITTDIEVVNFPVRDIKEKKLDIDFKNDFNFLVVAQWSVRKNLENTICWFIEEFIDQCVGLILKVNKMKNCILDYTYTEKMIQGILNNPKYANRKCSVELLHGYLEEGEMVSLYKHDKIKALINISHGEGFGLPMFEAIQQDLPVVTLDYSGQKDFLNFSERVRGSKKKKSFNGFASVDFNIGPVQPEAIWEGVIGKDTLWAYADQGSFKMVLRDVHRNINVYNKRAYKAKKNIKANFEFKDLSKKFVEYSVGSSFIETRDFDGISFCISTDGKKKEKTSVVIKNILSQMTSKKIEVILTGVVDEFEEFSDRITLNNKSELANDGMLSALRHEGAKLANNDVLVFLDDDMVLSLAWVWQLQEFSESEGWDVLGNTILNPDGSRFWDRCLSEPHVLVGYNHPETDDRLYQTGGFWVIRSEVYSKFSWDSNIPIYAEGDGNVNEDVEYSKRLYDNGYIIKFDKDNVVWHWDDNYTQVMVSKDIWQTLRISDILKVNKDFNKNEPAKEFTELLMILS